MPQVHSLAELTDLLETAAAGGTLVLNAALLPQAGEIAAFLAQAAAGVAITSAVVTPGATTVTVTGKAVLFAGTTVQYAVTLTGSVPQTTPLLTLSGTPDPAAGWTFSSSFPPFPDYLGAEGPLLKPRASFFGSLALTRPAFQVSTYDDAGRGIRRGVSFTGTLDATRGALSAIVRFLPPGVSVSALPLSGPLEVRAGAYPLADLAAPIPGLLYTFPQVALGPVELRLLSLPVSGAEPEGSSLATLAARATFGEADAVTVTVEAPVLQAQFVFTFGAALPPGAVSLANGLRALGPVLGGLDLPLPPGLDFLASIYLAEVSFGLALQGSAVSLAFASVTVGSDQVWSLPLPGMRVKELRAGWTVAVAETVSLLDASVTGVFAFGTPPDQVNVEIWTRYPEWAIGGNLREGDVIPVGRAIAYLTGNVLDVGTLNVVTLDMQAYPWEQSFEIFAEAVGDFPLVVPSILFEYFNFTVLYTPNTLNASLLARVSIAGRGFAAQAVSPRTDAQGWYFSGGLLPGQTFSLQDFATALLTPAGYSVTLPASVAAIMLTRLEAGFDTRTHDYAFVVRVEWRYTELGWPLAIAAELDLKRTRRKGGELAYAGHVQGEIQVNNLAVLVAYRFEPGSRTIFFQVAYKRLVLSAALVTRDEPPARLLVVRFPDVSLGELLEWLVGLAAPQLSFKLGSPWDLLNQISFKNLSLTVDLLREAVTLEYAVHASFVFMEIGAVGLTYVREGGRGRVKLALSGRFLDQRYSIDEGNPLEWDVISQPPPSVPARGPELIDIRYVGLGQRVALRDVAELTSVAAALAALKAQMKPPKDAAKNPLAGARLRFDPRSTFLFGVEVTLLRTVTLGIVLNDPRLYGLVVKLGGERAGSMSGLEFELLYRRVADDVGVFNVVLALPEAFRHFELGTVAITLPVIRVDIYTNGNFRVDLGFPRDGDFRDSFSVQVFPFVGYGGIYFAALNGTTSTRVPKITSGTFDPVIELGIGLSVGVGKEFRLGPLSGGATLTFQAILEGTFAWYTPNDRSAGKALYYWVQGTAALVARIYGQVDFYVVKASVSVEARASATVVLEAYEPTLVTARVSVEAQASLRVLFITVHFSFEVDAEVSFTIGSHSTPPWTLAAPEAPPAARRAAGAHPLPAQPRLRLQRGAHRPRDVAALTAQTTFSTPAVALRAARRLSAEGRFVPPATLRFARAALSATGPGDGPALAWEAVLVLDERQPLPLILLPALTVAPGAEGAAQVAAVPSLYLANSVAPDAYRAADVRDPRTSHLEAVESAGEAPFNLLLRAVLLWSIDALLGRHAGSVTLADLEQLYADLQDPRAEEGLPYQTLTGFLAANFEVAVTAPSSGPAAGSSAFPIIPDLALDGVSLLDNTRVGDAYRGWLSEYYAQLGVDYEAGRAATPAETRPGTGGAGELPPESLATVVFRDYFLMLARAAVQSAVDVLSAYRAVPTAQDSLKSIADRFAALPATYVVHAGDTVASIAATFGMSVARLEAMNGGGLRDPLTPGQVVNVEVAVTPARVAEANPGAALAPGVALATLTDVLYQLRAGDTLAGVGARFGVTAAQLLGEAVNAASRLLLQPATAADPALGSFAIAQPGSGDDYTSFTYSTAGGDTLASIAAWAYVRDRGAAQGGAQDWYAQTISDLNPGKIPPGTDAFGQPHPIPAGTGLLVPSALWDADAARALRYASRPGDTLPLVAGYFRVQQSEAEALESLESGMRALNPDVDWSDLRAGTAILVPALAHRVRAGESFAGLAALFGVSVADLAGANAASAGILAPLAVVQVPPISPRTREGDTLARVADRYNLTLAGLADDIATLGGIFGTDPAPLPLLVPGVPTYDVAALADRVVEGGLANQASAMVARYLLHGLRVPPPGEPLPPPGADAALEAFPVAVGQQVAVPTVPRTISVTTGAEWFQLSPSGPLPVTIDQAMLDRYGPALAFDPEVLSGPAALPFRTGTPVHYILQAARHWQTAEAIPFAGQASGSGPAAGEPTLWSFPAPLLAAVAEAGAAGEPVAGALYTGPRQGPSVEGPAVGRYDWAVSIDLKVRQIPSSTTPSALRNLYQVLGAAPGDRPRLLALWRHLSDPATADAGCTLYLLYSPNAGSNNPTGLASVPLAAGKTVLLKTNLSTLTTSNPLMAAALAGTPVPEDLYAAPVENAAGFLALLWEGSVTGTGGYTLSYAAADGAGLPDQLFATGATGSLTLVAILDAQSRETDPDRSLHSFNNCAVVGDNVDAASTSVFAEISVGGVARATTLAALQPGTLGFTLTRRDPTAGQAASAADRTRSLYSLLGYRVRGTPGAFAASHEGQPVDPAGATRGGVDAWKYQQVISISSLAAAHALPRVPGLPSPEGDPYAGVAAKASATLSFAFYDVFGNDLPPAAPVADLPVPVRYFDDVIGVSQWPGLSPSWRISGTPDEPALVVELALQVRNYSPGAGAGWGATLRTAAAHAARYQAVYYQLWQADVTAWLTTSLNQAGAAPAPRAVDPWVLGRFVNACLVHLGAAQRQVPVTITVGPGQTLSSVAAALSPGDPDALVAALGEANQAAPTASLFAGNLQVPDRVVAAYGDTLATLAGTATTPGDLAAANASLPLFAGTVAASPRRILPPAGGGAALAGVAADGLCTVAGIAGANRAVRGLLAAGAEVTVNGVSLKVAAIGEPAATQSLDDLAAAFALQLVYVDPATIAVDNQAVPGLLAPGATPAVEEYVVQPGDTFLTAAAWAVPGEGPIDEKVRALAAAAADTPNLFPSGSSLDRGVLRSVAPDLDPLAYLAQVEGVEVKEIAGASAGTPLVEGASLVLPDRYTMAAGGADALLAPYAVRAGDSLDSIAAAFGEAGAQALAERNREVTHLFEPGQPVAIPGTGASTTTTEADSLDSVWARLKGEDPSVTFEQVVRVVGPSTTLLAPGAFLEALAAKTGATAGTLAALTTRFGVEAAVIAQANASLDGLLAAGARVSAGGESLAVRAHDTFESLVARFEKEKGVTTTVAELAELNRGAAGLAAPSVTFLLPPRPATLAVAVSDTPGYGNAPELPGTIFPLHTRLVLARNAELVTGDGTGPAQQAASELAPRALPGPTPELTLRDFAASLKAAFPTLEVALGRPAAGGDEGAAQQTWAVSFGPAGIRSVSISGGSPSFFALKPLRNTLADRAGVPIRSFDPATGMLVPAEDPPLVDFQGIDLEVWAGSFLASVETFLAPAYAAPAHALDAQAFHDVVAAKKTLAGAISAGVDALLAAPAPAGSRADAAERLRQELLVNLSRAYQVETIVQYPVTAQSPYGASRGYSAGDAPRLAGRPSVRTAVSRAADTLDTLAAHYGVTAYAVAWVLAAAPDVLRAQAPIRYMGEDDAVPANSTLLSLTAYVGAPSLEALAENLEAPEGLFVAGAVLDISGSTVRAGQAGPVVVPGGPRLPSTFERVAAFFGTTLSDVTRNNQDAPGVFVPGPLTVTLPGRDPVTVTVDAANDTIARIAALVCTSPEALVDALAERDDVLAGDFVFHRVRAVPDAVFSAARTSLFDGASTMNLLFDVPSASAAESAVLDLRYEVDQLEHDITTVPGTGGYQASAWLSFVLPLDPSRLGGDLGQVEIPVPLRAYPPSPTLLTQTAVPAASPSTVAEAKAWAYETSYQHLAAAQDEVYVAAEFNLPVPDGMGVTRSLALAADPHFDALAQFTAVQPALSTALARLLDPDGGASYPAMARTLATFAGLVREVAAAWSYGGATIGSTPDAGAGETCAFAARSLVGGDGTGTYTLRLVGGTPSPGGTTFPDVAWRRDSTSDWEEMPRASCGESECVYLYQGAPAGTSLQHRIRFPGLDVAEVQNGFSGSRVTRNAQLAAAAPTSPAFVYQTGEVTFTTLLIPLVTHDTPVSINQGASPLAASLQALFTALLGPAEAAAQFRIAVAAQYGYSLLPGSSGLADSIISRLPILLYPVSAYTPSFPATLASQLQQWQANQGFSDSTGLFVLEVTVYSSLATRQIPILTLSSLVFDNGQGAG